jgi:hypothetical protein
MAFKDNFKDLYHLMREHTLLRAHNTTPGQPQDRLLMFAEGALVLMLLERFLRIVPEVEATDEDTLGKLLKKAVEKKVLVIPPEHRKGMLSIRNTILHGNFEQAAREAKTSSVEEYFKSQYASEIEAMYKIVVGLFDQINPATGTRKVPI